MSEPTTPFPDWTPEQKKKICEEMKKKFTAEDLLAYVNDTDEKFPMEEAMARVDAVLAEVRARKAGQ